MRKPTVRLLSAVMYILSFLSFFCLVGTDIISAQTVAGLHLVKFITALLIFVFGYFAAALRVDITPKANRKVMLKTTLFWLFTAYCFIVIDFTLIDDSFGRNVSNIFAASHVQVRQYLNENTNFVPFATVRLFCRAFSNGTLSFTAVAENLLGNLLVFMPFAAFLPLASSRFYRWKDFLIVLLFSIAAIEILQLALLTGSADIDDFILNAFGAVAAYAVLRLPALRAPLKKFTFGLWRGK